MLNFLQSHVSDAGTTFTKYNAVVFFNPDFVEVDTPTLFRRTSEVSGGEVHVGQGGLY